MAIFEDSLVSTAWLEAHLAEPALRIYDCTVNLVPFEGKVRPESGLAAWNSAHIPGSGFADLLADLCDRQSKLPLMMPSAEQLAENFGRYGIGPGSSVVLYDSGAHNWATRVWWMLRAVGFDDVAVLDGGFKRWQAEDRPISAEPSRYPPALFRVKVRPDIFANKAQVLASLSQKNTRLLNGLSADEHAGRVCRTARPGRIPGSGNVPAGTLLDATSGGFRSLSSMRETFDSAGALNADKVITYCGGGIAATSLAFNLTRLGHRNVAVYDGSLSEWSQDLSLPLESDGL